ncbi:ATPase component NatA [Pseudomonas syringae pv. actinidiae]|uniref:ATPase component NatA n=1 Tax=Pseudomonas syringae pv. actinidiae TaxID=103796 RepID=A0AAN4QDQ9_PSESF|nr:ATPase component NatA [Pseudomonas syringae pv. actinidiae]
MIETLGVGIDLQWHSPLRSTAIPKRRTDQLVVDTPLPTPVVLNESVFAFENAAAFLQRVSIIPQGGGFVSNGIDSVHRHMTVRIVGVLVNSCDVLMPFHAQLTNAVFGAFEYLRISRQFVFAPRQDEVIDRVLAATTLGGNHVHFRRRCLPGEAVCLARNASTDQALTAIGEHVGDYDSTVVTIISIRIIDKPIEHRFLGARSILARRSAD